MSNPFGRTFASFLQAGFECSSHRRRDGVRLDLIRATGHDKHVLQDYPAVQKLGFATVRDGLRWHLIEKSPGKYDWSSWLPALEAAEAAGIQVIWDLFHYGSPDLHRPGRARLSRALHRFRARGARGAAIGQRPPAARLPAQRDQLPVVGGRRRLFPAGRARRARLVQAAAGSDGDHAPQGRSSERWPDATIVWAEPLIHIAPHDRRRQTVRAAEQNLQGMYEAYDWIIGRGRARAWRRSVAGRRRSGSTSTRTTNGISTARRSRWATTNIGRSPTCSSKSPSATASRSSCPKPAPKDRRKPSWLHYVCNEVREAMDRGADDRGHLLVPDHRLSRLGQFAATPKPGCCRRSSPDGSRHVDERLLEEFEAQRALFGAAPAVRPSRPAAGLGDRRGLRILRRRSDERPAVAPFDAVDQQDPAAVDLVLLPLARPVHVDRVIDDPHLPGLVGRRSNCGPAQASARS